MAGLTCVRSLVFVLPRNRAVVRAISTSATRRTGNHGDQQKQGNDTRALESPLGPVKIPHMTLPQYIWKDFEEWADKPAITCGSSGRSYTYGEARFISHAFACALISNIGLKKGDCIGLLMPNIPEYVFAMYGALEAGLTVTFVNPLYTTGEILRQFENAGVKCCVTIPQLFKVAEALAPSLKFYRGTVVVGGDSDPSLKVFGFKEIVTNASANVILPEVSPNDVALLPYSSGTTGLPKGVMLTHTNCAVNLEQCNHPSIVKHETTSDTDVVKALHRLTVGDDGIPVGFIDLIETIFKEIA